MSAKLLSPIGVIPSGWKLEKLVNITTKIGSGSTPRGGESAYLDERVEYTFVRSQNVFDFHFSPNQIKFISKSDADKLKGVHLQKEDVLLNITGDGVTFARACIVPEDILPAAVNQHVSIIRVNKEKCLPGYLLAYLCLPQIKEYIANFNAGGSRRAITKGHIESFEVPIAPMHLQKYIQKVTFDFIDKIKLNTQTNQTLEAMAQALFKSWFIDFDPVKANMRGEQPVGMDAATAAQFPDKLVDATQGSVNTTSAGCTGTTPEFGLVPDVWEEKALYDIANYINGAAYKKFQPNSNAQGLPIVKIAELKSGITEKTGFSTVNMPEKYKILNKDILFSWSGNPDTSIDTFVWSLEDAWLNQHIFKVIANTDLSRTFLLCLLKSMKPIFAEIARDKQTTGLGHVTIKDLKRLKVVMPSVDVLDAFNRQVNPIIDMQLCKKIQNQELEKIRETLLPKLLSGEFQLPEAEQKLAEVH